MRQEATSFTASVTGQGRPPGRIGWLLLAPLVLWALAFVLAPAAIMLVYSFAERGTLGGVVLAFSPESYRSVIDPVFLQIVTRSLAYAGITTATCLLAGYPVAYLIGRADPRWRNLLLMAVMVPFWTSFLIRTYAWIVLLNPEGLINRVARALGFGPLPLLYNEFAVVVGLVYAYLPLMVPVSVTLITLFY